MTTFELILSVLTSSSLVGNIVQFVQIRSVKKKAQAEATREMDAVLYKRIEFLDERISRMEKLVCLRAQKCSEKL